MKGSIAAKKVRTATDYAKLHIDVLKNYSRAAKELSREINCLRSISMQGLDENLPKWPYDEVYVPDELIYYAFTKHIPELAELIHNEIKLKIIRNGLDDLRKMHHLLNFEKLSTMIRTPKLELDRNVLSLSSTVLGKLPQWDIVVNIFNYAHVFFGDTFCAFSFCSGYRSSEDITKLKADTDAKPFRFLSLAAFTDENRCVPLLKLRIDDSLTIGQSLEEAITLHVERANRTARHLGLNDAYDEAIEVFKNLAILMLNYLIFVLNNLDKLKKTNGKSAKLKTNPVGSVPLSKDSPILLTPNLEGKTILKIE